MDELRHQLQAVQQASDRRAAVIDSERKVHDAQLATLRQQHAADLAALHQDIDEREQQVLLSCLTWL